MIDSDLLIDFLRGREPGAGFYRAIIGSDDPAATTTVNVAELFHGAYRIGDQTGIRRVEELVGGLGIVPFTARAARRYGMLAGALDRAGTPVPATDLMVASIALEEGARLATRNVRHFERLAPLQLLTPGSPI